MFGYIKPDIAELKVKEYELYRAVYCGLCTSGGKTVSKLTRLLLSYDFVFLAMLRFSFTEEPIVLKKERCPFMPLKKRNAVQPCETMSYCASAFAVLTYFKLYDDAADSKGFKKVKAKILLWLCFSMKKRALRLYPELEDIVSAPLKELAEYEAGKGDCIDSAADCFARLLKGLAAYGFEGGKKRILESCGYHTGRFIYIADACDDMRDDESTGSYNPVLKSEGSLTAAMENLALYEATMNDSMAELIRAYELNACPDEPLRKCMRNIIINIAGSSAGAAVRKIRQSNSSAEKNKKGKANK